MPNRDQKEEVTNPSAITTIQTHDILNALKLCTKNGNDQLSVRFLKVAAVSDFQRKL